MRGLSIAFGGASIAVIGWALAAGTCAAQDATGAAQTTAGQSSGPSPGPAAIGQKSSTLGEVIVTARRRDEKLQDVPQSVVPVTANQLQQLQIKNVNEISTLVPGLNLDYQNPSNFTLSLRGVEFDTYTDGQPNVAFYIDDAPVTAGYLLVPEFDVGQIEVLRGPQGTTRGVSAPSGAITLTTRAPDMQGYGGYIDGELATHNGRDVNGAVNIPLIPGILAARVAGSYDENDAGGVKSVNSSIDPSSKAAQARISLRFTPNPAFEAQAVYQYLNQKTISFAAEEGPGDGTALHPALGETSMLSVAGSPDYNAQHEHLAIWQASYRFAGQRLSYVGSYQFQATPGIANEDPYDFLPGVKIYNDGTSGRSTTITDEVRLSSEHPQFGIFDYTIGSYYTFYRGRGDVVLPTELLPGAFGSPAAAPDLSAYNPNYLLNIVANLPTTRQELSFFGSATVHLPWSTELTGGVRRIDYRYNGDTNITQENSLVAEPASLVGGNCGAIGFGSTYPGFCDFPVPGGGTVVDSSAVHTAEHPVIYNVQLSHHFTPDVMVYASTGTSYRPPTSTIGIDGALASSTDPALENLNAHPSEHSTDYEAGVKSVFWNHRATVDLTGFYQKFNNFTVVVPNVQYLDTVDNQNTFFEQEASVGAKVAGFDLETAFRITPEWRITGEMEYSKLALSGQLPCNIDNASGPVYNTEGLISLCNGGRARLPLYSIVLGTDYNHPITDRLDGFVRVLANIHPSNPDVEPNYTTPSYSIVNVFTGIHSHDGAWSLTLFAKNLLNNKTLLDISSTPVAASITALFPTLSQPPGYNSAVSFAPERQFGIDLHYAWGGR